MTNITVSLETAKKMKEAGFNKYCEFCYDENQTLYYRYSINYTDYKLTDDEEDIEAPTAQEILDDLYNN